MKRCNLIGILFLLFFYGVSFAESVDITKDLQKNINARPNTPSDISNNLQPPSAQKNPTDSEVMKDIYDIKPLEKIGYDKRIIKFALIFLLVLLLIGLLIYLIDYFVRRRKREKIEELVVIPADIEAYKLLDDLKKMNDLKAREFYFRLTAILRGYMGRRFEIDAPEMTTEELLPQINDLDCSKNLKFNLKSLLTSTEPIKFAEAEAVADKMDDDFQLVTDFIKQTPEVTIDSEEG